MPQGFTGISEEQLADGVLFYGDLLNGEPVDGILFLPDGAVVSYQLHQYLGNANQQTDSSGKPFEVRDDKR